MYKDTAQDINKQYLEREYKPINSSATSVANTRDFEKLYLELQLSYLRRQSYHNHISLILLLMLFEEITPFARNFHPKHLGLLFHFLTISEIQGLLEQSHHMCSIEKSWKISQNSQENTRTRVSFSAFSLKKSPRHRCSCKFRKIMKLVKNMKVVSLRLWLVLFTNSFKNAKPCG